MNDTFLKAANSDKWTPHPQLRGIVYKRGVCYLDFTYRGKRVRYDIEETLPQRCKRLGKAVTQGPDGKMIFPQDEVELQFTVIERLANLKRKNS